MHCDEIDRTNILKATFKAMTAATGKLALPKKVLIVVDGPLKIPDLKFKQIAVKGADDKSLAVAAASIIAKVERDAYMCGLDKKYPGYDFAVHKGYGTTKHYEVLDSLGPSPEHRRSFLSLWHCVEKK
jgi:ribonuclease HII